MYVFTMKITISSIKIYQIFKETIMAKYCLFYEEEKIVLCLFLRVYVRYDKNCALLKLN